MLSIHLKTPLIASLFTAAIFTSATTIADTVEIPVGNQGYVAEASHLRGKEQNQVTEEFGEPLGVEGPVGEPAITRWEYTEFYVFFENNRVLHTVSKHRG